MSSPELIIVGRVRKAHGIRGEMVVESITDMPAVVYEAGRRVIAGTATGDPAPGARELVIAASRSTAQGWLVRFEGITDRNEAELWRDRYLLSPRAELAPLVDGEVYQHELLGMTAVLTSGETVGRVAEIYELPQGLMLNVERDGAELPGADRGVRHRNTTVVVPAYGDFLREIDRDAGRIVLHLPEGLLE